MKDTLKKFALLAGFTSLLFPTFKIYAGATTPNKLLSIQSKKEQDSAWQHTNAVSILQGETLNLKVSAPNGAKIRWFQIIPDLSKTYKNANFPWEKDAYQWVGYGKIDYERIEIEAFRDQTEIKIPEAISKTERPFYQPTLGSFWFQVEVEQNGETKRSAGLEENDTRGLSLDVFRVSIRSGNDNIGYLTGFFNVPGIFGSVPYQSENYLGVDCADALITAHVKQNQKTLPKNYNVAMLVSETPKIAEFNLDRDGNPDKDLNWNKDLESGDWIAVRYAGKNQYQHIGALAKDTNQNGKLDSADLVLHAGPEPLHFSALGSGPFEGHIVVLRAKK